MFVVNTKKYLAYQTMGKFRPQSAFQTQCAVYTLYLVYILNPICSLHFILTDFDRQMIPFFFGFLWSSVSFFHSFQFVQILHYVQLGF